MEIFFKTRRAWTFFSEYVELIFALFFFIFCFEYPIGMFLFNRIWSEGLGVDLKDGRLRKGYQILWMDEKTKLKNKNAFHPAREFDTLSFASVYCFLLVKRYGLFSWNCSWWPFLGFDFWGYFNVLWKKIFDFYLKVVLKMESIFKKQCIIIHSATVQ